MSTSGNHLNKDFFLLIKAIGESKTKQEEDRIVTREVAKLKAMMKSRKLSKKDKKEFLVRMIYAEMLGHDASFGYIRAVELTADSNVENKRVGYLCSALCLSPEHEFRFMLVNVMSGDLDSPSKLIVSTALSALTKIVTKDMIPVLLPKVQKLMTDHDSPRVRAKAVMAMQRFRQLDVTSTRSLIKTFRVALCDKSPTVMAASLNIMYDLIRSSPTAFKSMTTSFVSILKQVTEHRLPDSFDYHRIPAPWVQMKILKILALLGEADASSSEKMYPVLHTCMKRADTGINVGYAIVYECVRTVTSIYPNAKLLDAAAAAISRFISSDNHNLKYLGITSLANIVQDHPQYAAQHQGAVLDCLEDKDETIRRKTLALLARMTNEKNVGIVTEKSLQFLRETTDEFLRKQLVSRITGLAERYAPTTMWYVETIVTLLEVAGELVQPVTIRGLLRIIAEGADEDDEEEEDGDEETSSATEEMRLATVEQFLKLCEKPKLPEALVQVIAWTLGEYGYLLNEDIPLPDVARKLCALAVAYPNSRGYIVTALTKITAQLGSCLTEVVACITKFGDSKDSDVQQRCTELSALLQHPDVMKEVLPVDASTEDVEVDEGLSFLDAYVAKALANGARPYAPPSKSDFARLVAGLEDDDDDDDGDGLGLRYEAYAMPEDPTDVAEDDEVAGTASVAANDRDAETKVRSEKRTANSRGGLVLGAVKGPWGASGYHDATASSRATARDNADDVPTVAATLADDDGDDTNEDDASASGAGGEDDEEEEEDEEDEEEDEEEDMSTPHVPSEREKLAAGLFGGIGATTSTSGSRWGSGLSSSRRRKKSPPKRREDPISGDGEDEDSLLSVDNGDVKANDDDNDDLLGGLFDAAPTAATTSAPSGGDDADLLGDMLGGLDVVSGGDGGDAAEETTGASKQSNGVDSFFDLGNGGSSESAAGGLLGLGLDSSDAVLTPVSVPDMTRLAPPPDVVRVCSGHTRVPAATNIDLGTQGSAHLSFFKVYRPKELLLVVYIANGSASDATYTARVESNGEGVRVALACGTSSSTSSSLRLPDIPSQGHVALRIALTCTQAESATATKVMLALESDDTTPAVVPISCRDLFRPTRMSTKQFGPLWVGAGRSGLRERKVAIRSSCVSLDEFVKQCSERIGFYPIETIHKTSEHIAALELAGHPSSRVLLHVKYSPTKRTAVATLRGTPPLQEIVGKLCIESLR
eukprot:g1847.t1